MRRSVLLCLSGVTLLALLGCKAGPAPQRPERPLPAYAEVVAIHNQRVERLDRLWARTIVSMRYVDVDGHDRYEQGDGHLQRLDVEKLALSVGKLGETLFWFGADETRYWLFDLTGDRSRVYVGLHEMLTLAKAERASLPVPPRQYVTLAGLTALPDQPIGLSVAHTASGAVRIDLEQDKFLWVYLFDPVTLLPSSVHIVDEEGYSIIESHLSGYRSAKLTGVGVNLPRAPGRIGVTHHPTQTTLTLTIDGDIIDGRRSDKPRPQAFDFDVLVGALGPDEIIDLDRPEEIEEPP